MYDEQHFQQRLPRKLRCAAESAVALARNRTVERSISDSHQRPGRSAAARSGCRGSATLLQDAHDLVGASCPLARALRDSVVDMPRSTVDETPAGRADPSAGNTSRHKTACSSGVRNTLIGHPPCRVSTCTAVM